MKILIKNAIRTPDGTILVSRHGHDFVSYKDKNGQYYAVDGGLNYSRKVFDKPDFEDISVYDDDDFEVIRESLERGTYGKNGDEELRYVVLKDIDDEWLGNIIEYEQEKRPNNPYLKFYLQEKEYRKC